MSDNGIKIKNVVNLQERCDVCHQSDMFDAETQFCGRCQHIALVASSKEEKLNAAPLPEFLARKLSSNTAIRCRNCNQFIMSRDPSCRHCGVYLRFDESAQDVQSERFLTEAFEKLNTCKSAAGLSLEYLKFHFWFFPLILLTPLTAVGSFVLFIRTLWLSLRCWLRLSYFKEVADNRIVEGYKDLRFSLAKSLGSFLIITALGVVVAYSGAMMLPIFWDNYTRGQKEFNVGRYVEAEAFFAKALKNNPDDIEVNLYYARSIWRQYINDSNADKEKNKATLNRAVAEFRHILEITKDVSKKDIVYLDLALIYKTIGNREEYEQWLLARARLEGQSTANQADCYIKLATAYGNDISDLMQLYVIKERVGRDYQTISNWKPEDLKKLESSAKKALSYLDEVEKISPQNTNANVLRNNIYRAFEKTSLQINEIQDGAIMSYEFKYPK
jgi:tetratricopeptide (TPR) repeat protein